MFDRNWSEPEQLDLSVVHLGLEVNILLVVMKAIYTQIA